eukprot:jgi/Psemu1/308813/fgenesh1_kg.447_\
MESINAATELPDPKPPPVVASCLHEHEHEHEHGHPYAHGHPSSAHPNHIVAHTSTLEGVYNAAFTVHLVAWTIVASALLAMVRVGTVGCRWAGAAARAIWNGAFVFAALLGRWWTSGSGGGKPLPKPSL